MARSRNKTKPSKSKKSYDKNLIRIKKNNQIIKKLYDQLLLDNSKK